MRTVYYIFFIIFLINIPNSNGAVTITWDRVTKDINNNDETGTIYYYIFCFENLTDPFDLTTWVGVTTDTVFNYSDPRQSIPEITLYYDVVAVDEWGNSSTPITLGDQTLPVNLAAFETTEKDGRVTLNWTTASELDISGFNILKAEQANGPFVKINPELIAGKGTSTTSTEYEYIDENVTTLKTYYYQLQVMDLDGTSERFGPYAIFVRSGIPESFSVTQNYPNPFNPLTQITFSLPREAHITLDIYNINGHHVTTLVDGIKETGTHSVTWDGHDNRNIRVASGIYFYKFKSPGYSETKSMTLIK